MLKDYKPVPFEYDHACEARCKINERINKDINDIKEAFNYPQELFAKQNKFKGYLRK